MLDLRRLRKEVASILRDYYIIKCNCLLIYHLLFWLRRKRRKNELFQKSKKCENLKFLRFLLSIYFPVFPSFPSGVFQRPCLVGCRRFFDTKRKFLGFSIRHKHELIKRTPRGLIAAVSILLKQVHSEMVSIHLFDRRDREVQGIE